jgi:hypothetical protein
LLARGGLSLLLPAGEKVGMRADLATPFILLAGRQVAHLRWAFAGLPASELLLFAGPKRSSQEKWPYRARRPYKPCRSRVFGTCVAPPVQPSATPRRRRSLRVERGCRGLWCLCLLARGGRFNPALSISAHAVMSRPAFAFARHPGAGRDPVTSVCGCRDDPPLPLLDSGLRRNDGEGTERMASDGWFGHVGAGEARQPAAVPRWPQ